MVIQGRITTKILLALFFAMTTAACAPSTDGEGELAMMGDDGEVEELNPDVPPAPDRVLTNAVLNEPTKDPVAKAAILAKYKHLDPNKVVPKSLLETAILTREANLERFPNKNYVGVIDFSKKSSKSRWFVVDLKTGSVWAIHVAHGRGSDSNRDGYAEKFSNVHGSNASSLGVFRVSETYESSKFGYSVRVDGLSSTNSNARARAIVIHPAWYVTEGSIIQGNTAGCFGVSKSLSRKLIDMIKNGSMLYVSTSGVK